MTNPIFTRLIERGPGEKLTVMGMSGEASIQYTDQWIEVDGGNGVRFRPWIIEGLENVDGADIEFEAKGSYTPIQLVNSANVVVDTPTGKSYCCVMASGWKEPKVYRFDGSKNNEQMVWEQGMLIFWISEEPMKLTEFEKPAYNDKMFINIFADQTQIKEYPQLDLAKFRNKVNQLKEIVKSS